MKISPTGKKIGLVTQTTSGLGTFQLYDFDNATGVVSNSLSLGTNYPPLKGCEFSSDGTKFYGSVKDVGIYQWDLCAGSNNAIVASQQSFACTFASEMQLARDKKIYISRDTQHTFAVINNPNSAGAGCNYVMLGQSITPKSCGPGLPGFCK